MNATSTVPAPIDIEAARQRLTEIVAERRKLDNVRGMEKRRKELLREQEALEDLNYAYVQKATSA